MTLDDRYLFATTLPSGATMAIAAAADGGHVLVDVIAGRRLGWVDEPVTVFLVDGRRLPHFVVAGVAAPPADRVELEGRTGGKVRMVRNGVWLWVPIEDDLELPTAVVHRDARSAEVLRLSMPASSAFQRVAAPAIPAGSGPEERGSTSYAPAVDLID